MSMFERGHPIIAWRPAPGTGIERAAVDICGLVAMGTAECVLLHNGLAITVTRTMRAGDVVMEYERRLAEVEGFKHLEEVARIVSEAARRALVAGTNVAIEDAAIDLEHIFSGYEFRLERSRIDELLKIVVKKRTLDSRDVRP